MIIFHTQKKYIFIYWAFISGKGGEEKKVTSVDTKLSWSCFFSILVQQPAVGYLPKPMVP